MTEHYLEKLANTINENWNLPALTDFYLTEDGSAQDKSRGNHYTYGEMYQEILHVCDIFNDLGIQKGDHIAICGANSSHWAIAYLAIAVYQGVAVTILHSQSLEDIAHQIDFSDSKALFTDEDLWEELQSQSLPQIEHVICLENWQILCGKEIKIKNLKLKIKNRGCQFAIGDPNALALICFTSGSTGVSKGVMHTNRSMTVGTYDGIGTFPICSHQKYLASLPFAHVYGLQGEIIAQLLCGHNILIACDIITPSIWAKALKVAKPYLLMTVPKMVELLYGIDEELITSSSNYGILQITVAGSVIDKGFLQSLYDKKVPIVGMYGLTERIAISGSNYMGSRQYTCGRVSSNNRVKINERGEILVKGEGISSGYHKNDEFAHKIDKDGWLHTGDKGHLDEDGYLYVEGRLEQDMIVLPNGENIHPEDIERKINALHEVKESIVLARDGKLVAIVVADTDIRRHVLRTINPELPLYSQLYDVEITDVPLQKTEKQTLKRYLYK